MLRALYYTTAIILLVLGAIWGVARIGRNHIPFYTSANEAVTTTLEHTRASQVAPDDLRNRVFIGAAFSGGGSRAANFSAAALLSLEKLGLLQHITVLSPVSGSTLPVTYYALYGTDPTRWNPNNVRELFRKNYESNMLRRFFLPHNWLRMWLTNFDRSDLMASVFDDVLFDGKTFAALGPSTTLPHLLINATTLSPGERFPFTDDNFGKIGSRLSSYPLSHAVMASAAFPGVFDNVTLTDWKESAPPKQPHYVHLVDGGANDNLGFRSLLDNLEDLLPQTSPDQFNGCFLFVVDSFPERTEKDYRALKSDTREPLDYLVNLNMLDAAWILLEERRAISLADYFTTSKNGIKLLSAQAENDLHDKGEEVQHIPTRSSASTCLIWHLSFSDLNPVAILGEHASFPQHELHRAESHLKELRETVNSVGTRFSLKSPLQCEEDELQNALYEAATLLIEENKAALTDTCSWFKEHGFDATQCMAVATAPPRSFAETGPICKHRQPPPP